MEFQISTTLHLNIKDDDIDTIISAALEEGIRYWCSRVESVEGNYIGQCPSAHLIYGGALRLYDSDGEFYDLTLNKLLNGIRRAFYSGYEILRIVGNRIDADYIDGDAADFIVQYALFGKLIHRGRW